MKRDRGQASIEYILMLSVAAMMFLLLYKVLLKPVLGKLTQILGAKMGQALGGSDLHRLPFGL